MPKLLANITAATSYVPDKVVKNSDLEKIIETSDEWIQSRTGIKERRFVSDGESTSTMVTRAAEELLYKSNVNADEIDAILVATITPDMMFPSTAALVQDKINAKNSWGFDISAACSGFLFALETASCMISSGRYNKIIVAGADTMSSILNFNDRTTSVLFGDGAGAVLLEPSYEYGIIDSLLHIDGSGGKHLYMPGGGSLNGTSSETIEQNMHYVHQDGKIVFKHAVRGMADITEQIATRNNINKKNLKLFVPHQANKKIIDAAAKRLGLDDNQVIVNIDKYANTTAGTIPICISEIYNNKLVNLGENIILSSFGAGFTWGAIYLKWGAIK
mgnify:CR=1 FL=1